MSKLNGKTASELRSMLANGEATKVDVIAHLVGKDKIAHPSRMLLAELQGEAPKASTKAKPTAKPAAKAQAKAPTKAKPAQAASKTMDAKTSRNIERMRLIGTMASHIMDLARAFEELEG